MSNPFTVSLPWMLTATFRIVPDVPENDTADDGHDDGFVAGSAMQTRPVAAPARGIARGVESDTRSRTMKARSFLEAFKYFFEFCRSSEES